jgi:hypothetical protein
MLATPAYSDDKFTASELYKKCTAPKGGSEQIYCEAYIHGFMHGLWSGEINAEKKITLCKMPDTINTTEARLVVEKYMREHPEKLNQYAGVVAQFAFIEEYGCKKN